MLLLIANALLLVMLPMSSMFGGGVDNDFRYVHSDVFVYVVIVCVCVRVDIDVVVVTGIADVFGVIDDITTTIGWCVAVGVVIVVCCVFVCDTCFIGVVYDVTAIAVCVVSVTITEHR